jgi:hypothetical protein
MSGWITLTIWLAVTLLFGGSLIVQPAWMISNVAGSATDVQKRNYLRKAGFAILVIGIGYGVIKLLYLTQVLQ